jgi:uncharacterized membrane protein YidH (DUF202 family)
MWQIILVTFSLYLIGVLLAVSLLCYLRYMHTHKLTEQEFYQSVKYSVFSWAMLVALLFVIINQNDE